MVLVVAVFLVETNKKSNIINHRIIRDHSDALEGKLTPFAFVDLQWNFEISQGISELSS